MTAIEYYCVQFLKVLFIPPSNISFLLPPTENHVQCREAWKEAGAPPPLFQGAHQVPSGNDEAWIHRRV